MQRDEFLGERRQALEDLFFHHKDQQQLQALRAALDKQQTRAELRRASGIADDAVLDQLIELGLTGQTVAALSLVPLLQVAWADGHVQPAERDAILRGAHGKGIEEGSEAHRALSSWLAQSPNGPMWQAWLAYIKALCDSLNDQQQHMLGNQILAFARGVAEAAGGFLGIHKVSAAEQRVLDAIAAAFA